MLKQQKFARLLSHTSSHREHIHSGVIVRLVLNAEPGQAPNE
jgi:hypothetical protein